MGARRLMDDAERRGIVDLYLAGEPIPVVAERFGRSGGCVYTVLNGAGARSPGKRGGPGSRKLPPNLTFYEWLMARCSVEHAGYITPCWLWTGRRNEKGYARDRVPAHLDGDRKNRRIHRFAYERLIGPIGKGLVTDHLCRNRHCCNPAHLEPVTNEENIRRGLWPSVNPDAPRTTRGPRGPRPRTRWTENRTHCAQGHALTPETIGISKNGNRRCRICHRASVHAAQAKKRIS